jgi:hypothetical protein
MRSVVALSVAVSILACGCGKSAEEPRSAAGPEQLVLRTGDLPRGYEYGDDSACGIPSTEGDWPTLEPLFSSERPSSCAMQLEWVWKGEPPYSSGITSAAYRFGDAYGARRAFDLRDELASFTATLDVKERAGLRLGDEAELLRGRGLNNPATGAVWREGDVVAVLVVEPANEGATRTLAEKQQRRLEQPSPRSPQQLGNDAALQLDDPALKLPVHWVGRRFDPPGALPPLELELANVGGNGPGQSVQLWYRGGISLDTWEPEPWKRFRRTRLGRLIWDSPCTRKTVVKVAGGRAEIFQGYGEPNPVQRPCPKRRRDRVLAHVYYGDVIVAVNMPYCYTCARPTQSPNPYNTVDGIETVVRSLRLRVRRS